MEEFYQDGSAASYFS